MAAGTGWQLGKGAASIIYWRSMRCRRISLALHSTLALPRLIPPCVTQPPEDHIRDRQTDRQRQTVAILSEAPMAVLHGVCSSRRAMPGTRSPAPSTSTLFAFLLLDRHSTESTYAVDPEDHRQAGSPRDKAILSHRGTLWTRGRKDRKASLCLVVTAVANLLDLSHGQVWGGGSTKKDKQTKRVRQTDRQSISMKATVVRRLGCFPWIALAAGPSSLSSHTRQQMDAAKRADP